MIFEAVLNKSMQMYELFEAKKLPQRPVTQTPAFKAWFAGSKVVDRQGRPLVLYHGTRNNFATFENEYSRGVLSFFTTSPKFASGHASAITNAPGLVMPVYLRITNPFDYRHNPERIALDFWENTGGIDDSWDREQIRTALYFDPKIDDSQNPLIQHDELSWEEFATALKRGDYPAFEAAEFVDWLKHVGYDGLVMREGGGITYAIFEPNQVKSALSNTNFDPESPVISEDRVLA